MYRCCLVNCFYNRFYCLAIFTSKKHQIFAGSSFKKLRFSCFSLSFIMVNEESLDFGLLVGQFEDVTLKFFHHL